MSVARCAAAAADGVSDVSVVRSWPSSPLSASRQVTARLYSSLQQSRQQEVRGHATDRQVSFALSTPDLTAATPPLLSHRLEELSLDSHDVIGSEVEGLESDAEEVELLLQKRSAPSTSGRKHIEEMESVRTHLQSILRTTQTTADRRDYLTPASQHFMDESQISDSTSRLLSGVCAGGVEELFPRYSRLHSDSSCAVSELQVMRDSLERERERRKVCEQQVASLHSRVLHLQQQLTLAVAADRKKDIMIEQLDKTLVKVVEGWKRHDQERNEEMKRLQEERETAEKTHKKHAQALSRVEQNLSQVEETLIKEQKHNQELQKTNKRLEQEVSDLRVRVEDLQQEEQKLRSEAGRHREQLHKLQTESHETQTKLQQRTQELEQHTQQLQQQLHTLTDQVKREVSAREEADSRTRQLQEELETTRRERDAVRVERALEQTQFEAQKSQMEAEFGLSLEQQMSDRLTAVQEEHNTYNTRLRHQHRKQLLDLSARHERELTLQQDQCRTQLQETDDKLQSLTHAYQHRLSEMQEQLVSMAATKRKLEMQREELVSRLQGMMRSHWAEALRLLTNQEQMESILSPVHQWDSSKISSSPPKTDAAPQAVVLHLSREKEKETLRAQRESGLMSFSTSFRPLEPQLENTDLTALSDCSGLWVRPVFTVDETLKESSEETREAQPLLKLNHSQCEPKLKQSHAPADTWTNHSSTADSGLSRGGASSLLYRSDSEKTPPSMSRVSALNEDRQNELQYYVSKLLERSPGEPLDEPIREQQSESVQHHVTDLRSDLEQKPERAPSRCVQSRRAVNRRGGPQRVWR